MFLQNTFSPCLVASETVKPMDAGDCSSDDLGNTAEMIRIFPTEKSLSGLLRLAKVQ